MPRRWCVCAAPVGRKELAMKMRIFWCVALAAAVAAQAKELAVLSVGNSFSRNAHRYLREIVAASEGDTLTLEN